MELKFIFSFIVILHLRNSVSGASVEDCIGFVYLYPEDAKGFADEDAKQEDLDLAIGSITKAFWNPDDSSLRDYDYFDWAEDESRITADLTQCYEARKVYFFGYYNCNLTFILLFCLSRIQSS